MTSASMADEKTVRTASRGVHAVGSFIPHNGVLINPGTPLRSRCVSSNLNSVGDWSSVTICTGIAWR